MALPVTPADLRRTLVAGLVVALALLGSAPQTATAAPNVTCGQVLTESVVLNEDLTCLRGESLPTIGADNVVFDLGGHTIYASDAEYPDDIINPGFDNFTITNGTIDGGGVSLQNAHNNEVSGLLFDGSEHHVRLAGVTGSRIVDNRFDNADIWLDASHGNLVAQNTMRVGSAYLGVIILRNSHRNTLRGNETSAAFYSGITVHGNDNKLIANRSFDNDSHGFVVNAGARRTQLRGNYAEGNGGSSVGHGFLVEAGAIGTKLIGNTAIGNDYDGFHIDEARTTLVHNTSVDNGLFGYHYVVGVTRTGNYAANNGSGGCFGC